MMGDTTAGEKRRYSRLRAKQILSYEKFNLTASDFNTKFSAISKNISASGILFEAVHKFDLGDMLKLELFLPDLDKYFADKTARSARKGPNYTFFGVVVRVESVLPNVYDIGVCFVETTEAERNALFEYIETASKVWETRA
jgi:hypothetical protein